MKNDHNVETVAQELHKNDRRLNWLRWDQLTRPCQDEFRQDARRKSYTQESPPGGAT